MKPLVILCHPDYVLHDTGAGHPERADRVRAIEAALKSYPFKDQPEYLEPPLATREQLLLAHDEKYVDWIFSVPSKEDLIGLDADTIMSPHSLQAALRAAGAVVYAVDIVMQDKAQVVFCNVRPPGHHAEYDKAMGFCFFNNVAIGVKYALKQYDLKRIAIVDFDVHHGNGTQHIFQNDARVLLCSSFEHPFYPGYDPNNDNDHIICVPLPANTNGERYRELVAKAWFERIAAFKPELIFFSAGFDAHMNDPLADINLTKADYEWITTQIAELAQKYCHGKMISVLEGGYDLAALSECVPAHINAMLLS